MDTPSQAKKSVLRYLRWRDLIVVLVGLALGFWINHGYSFREPTDYQKWQARPQLRPMERPSIVEKPGENGLQPCLFIVPKGVVDQPVPSGSVGDCLRLVPDGAKRDVFEIVLQGDFVHVKTDLYVDDVMSLAFTRCVIPLDDWAKRQRVYLPHVYDPFLSGDRFPYTYLDWTLPDRAPVRYQRVSPGTGFADAVYEAMSNDPIFVGSRTSWNGWGWDLTLEDGTTFLSPEAYNAKRPQQGSLVGIFDKQGHEVRLTRKSSGDLAKIESPSRRWIKFSYDEGHIIEAKDSLGNGAKYTYDVEDRLVSVDYAAGSTIKYWYDSANRIVRIEDSLSGTTLENKYSRTGSIEQTTIDGETYGIRHLVDEVQITGPQGAVTRVHITENGRNTSYTVEKLCHGSDRQ